MAQQIPSNKEIQETLEQVKTEISTTGKQAELDSTGKKILADTKEVVKTAQQFVAEKNPDEKLQKLVKESQLASQELQEHAQRLQEMQSEALSNIDSEKLRQLAEDTLKTARMAGMELMSSSAFRQSCMDFIKLVADILGDVAQDVGEEVKEVAGEKLQQGAQRLQENVGAGIESLKQTLGKENVEAGVEKMKDVIGRDNVEAGKQKMKDVIGMETESTSLRGIESSPGMQPMEAYPTSTMTSTSTSTATTTSTGGSTAYERPAKKMMRGEGDQVQNVKETAEGVMNKGLELAGLEKRVELSQDQVDELYNRFMAIVRQVSERERTKKVFSGFLDMLNLIRDQAQETSEQVKSSVQETAEAVQQSKHLNRALCLAQEVFEQFTGTKSLDPLVDRFKSLADILANDKETNRYFIDVRTYLGKIFQNPDLLNDEQFVEKGKRLIRRGREINNKKVYTELNGISRELNRIIDNVQNDPLTLKMKESMQKLVSDLVLDSDGNIVWKPEVMEQLRLILVSSIVERMKIPLPTIHVEDDNIEYTLSGLVLSLKHLLPEKIGIESRGKAVFDLSEVKDPSISGAGHALRITLENINVYMPDAYLWFRRKTFPRLEDEGRAHIEIGGRGLDIVVILRTFLRSDNIFNVSKIDCNIHNLEFSLSDTTHDFLYNTLIRMFSGTVKNDIESSIENNIKDSLEQLNVMLRGQIARARDISASSVTETIKQGISQTISTVY
jgi:hypothetical protein